MGLLITLVAESRQVQRGRPTAKSITTKYNYVTHFAFLSHCVVWREHCVLRAGWAVSQRNG